MENKTYIDTRRIKNALIITINSNKGKNTIDNRLIDEIDTALANHKDLCTVVVLEGNDENFCVGADISSSLKGDWHSPVDPEKLYSLWKKLRFGEFVTISHVKGNCIAGGIGFVSSSDIVISNLSAKFMLSEMFFNLYPACVIPFLVTKIGIQQANVMTLLCNKITSDEAKRIGLVDIIDRDSDSALRRCLAQVAHHSKDTISKYKKYMHSVASVIEYMHVPAVRDNNEMFFDTLAIQKIKSYFSTHGN